MSRTTASPRRTFAVLASAAAAFSVLQSLVSPVLPTIQRDLGTTQSAVAWVLTAWLLSASVATPLLGRIGDMIGKRRILLIALGATVAGCLLAALAPNIGVLICARVIQGLGGALFPVSFGIIRDEFPAERVPSAVGGLSAILAAGGGAGIVLSGPIVAALGWRWLFWIPMVLVAAAAVMVARYVPESPVRTPGRVAWPAAILLSGWLVALLVPLSKASSWGWGSPIVITLFVLAAIGFTAWVWVELRSRDPLVDMRMMRRPVVWTTNLVALLFGAGMFAVTGFLPVFLQIPAGTGYGFGFTVAQAGLVMLPMLATMSLGGFLSGPLGRLAGAKAQLVGSALLSTASCVAFTHFHDRPWKIAVAGAVFGLGLGLAYAGMSSLIVQGVPPHQTGVASGMNANIRNIGGSIGTAVFASVVTAHLQPGGSPAESGFTWGFLLLAATSAITVVLALLVPTVRRQAAVPLQA
ncbi:MFS transporter [Herbidospora daliensis]|uniref:MFS transporter n=1 Tax=Herbidospora daliensis TaxID=295585 RepID=UPI00078283C9|nr:MFS transporter [Herbidospora daliensis]